MTRLAAATLVAMAVMLACTCSSVEGSTRKLQNPTKGQGKIGLELWFSGTAGESAAQQKAAKKAVADALALEGPNVKPVKEIQLNPKTFKIDLTILGFSDQSAAQGYIDKNLNDAATPKLASALNATSMFSNSLLDHIVATPAIV